MATEPHTGVHPRLRPVDLAREHGLSAQAVRTYERDGILPPCARTSGGHRAYTAAHARALRAFVALVPAHGHAVAREILRAVHEGEVERALSLVDDSHDRLRRDRAVLDTVALAVGASPAGGDAADRSSTVERGPAVPALDGPLSVGELARRLGVVPATLRAWERAGILAPDRVRPGASGATGRGPGQRRFTPEDVRDAELVALLRRGGTGLARIAVVVAQVRGAGGTDELAASLDAWRARLHARGRAMLAGAGALAAVLDGVADHRGMGGSAS